MIYIRVLKANLSRPERQKARGETVDAPQAGQTKRLGFMAGRIAVPDDFDRMGRAEIARLFGLT